MTTHAVPRFEGTASRRHERLDLDELRGRARAYAASGAAPDLSRVETMVQFAGFPRSGHSLVGSVIDAHDEAVVAHELDAMGLVAGGLSRAEVFALVAANSAEFERHGRWWNGFEYKVADGSGGVSPRPRVLGDKKGDWAVRRVADDPGLLPRLRGVLGEVRAAWVVVLRNPFDNVATLSLRRGRAYDRIRIAAGSPEEFRRALARAQGAEVAAEVVPAMVEDYAHLCDGLATMRAQVAPEDWFELRHEDLVVDPEQSLRRLFDFLRLPVTPDFLRRAGRTVHGRPNRTRHQVAWSAGAREQVARLTETHPFLAGYTFDGD